MFVWRERQRNLERCSRETKRVKVIQIDLHAKKERVYQRNFESEAQRIKKDSQTEIVTERK